MTLAHEARILNLAGALLCSVGLGRLGGERLLYRGTVLRRICSF